MGAAEAHRARVRERARRAGEGAALGARGGGRGDRRPHPPALGAGCAGRIALHSAGGPRGRGGDRQGPRRASGDGPGAGPRPDRLRLAEDAARPHRRGLRRRGGGADGGPGVGEEQGRDRVPPPVDHPREYPVRAHRDDPRPPRRADRPGGGDSPSPTPSSSSGWPPRGRSGCTSGSEQGPCPMRTARTSSARCAGARSRTRSSSSAPTSTGGISGRTHRTTRRGWGW